jgi:hypothetical protein
MTSRIVVRQPEATSSESNATESYWKAENHDPNSLLRVENWRTEEIAPFCLPTRQIQSFPLTASIINALLRYREELKMYAALEDNGKS